MRVLALVPAELPDVPVDAACVVVLAVQLILLCPVILLQLLVVHLCFMQRLHVLEFGWIITL